MYKNVPAALTLHWTDGFLLKPFASPTYVFNYNFSQLKGSSDDGNATLKLVFEDPRGSKEVVEQVILDWAKFCIMCYFVGSLIYSPLANLHYLFISRR